MENKVLSIEIGDLKTKICVMNQSKKHPRIYRTFVFDTPMGAVEDGYIHDSLALTKEIVSRLLQLNEDITEVIFTIFSSRIATHEVIIPPVKAKDIGAYVAAGAQDYFPINVSDYVISYMLLEKGQTKQERFYRLLAIAIHNNLLQTYYDLAARLKLNIISIDYLSNSILQVFQRQISHKGTNMYVHVNEKNTLVFILHNGIPELHRTIAYGYEDIPLRNPHAIDNGDEVTGTLRYLINNIIRVIEYYTSKNKDKLVQTIYLNGAGGKVSRIEELLNHELEIPIKIFDELHGIHFRTSAVPDTYRQWDFMGCIGAIYAPLGIVPKQFAEKQVKKTTIKELVTVCSIVFLSCCTLVILSAKSLSEARKEKMRLNNSIASLEALEKVYNENAALTDKLNLLTAIEDSCVSNTEQLNELISELEKKLPDNVIIRSMQVSDTDIILDVSMNSKEAAAMTFLQMGTIDRLTEVSTEQITIETDEYGGTKLSYIITAKYAPRNTKG